MRRHGETFKWILLIERDQLENTTYCWITAIEHFGKGKTLLLSSGIISSY